MTAIGVRGNNPGDLTVTGPNSYLYDGQTGVYSSPNGLYYPTFGTPQAGGSALDTYINNNVGTDPNSSLTTPSEFASYYLNGSYGPLTSTTNNPHAQSWLSSFLSVIGIGANGNLASVPTATIAQGIQKAEGTTSLGTNIFGGSVSNGQSLGNVGDGGILGGAETWISNEVSALQTGGSFLAQNGVVAGAAVLAGASPGAATANPVGALGGSLFGPLIAWFNTQEAGFEAAIPNAVERWAIGLVAFVLIAAGLFFLVSGNKTVQLVASRAALAAA